MRVRVYRNLHRDCYSVQTYVPGKGWRVAGHRLFVRLTNAEFKVSEAGRQRVLREKKKNVHAFVEGDIVESFDAAWGPGIRISYDPYRSGSFESSFGPVKRADALRLEPQGIQAWGVQHSVSVVQ